MIGIVVPSGDLIHADTAWCIWQNSITLFKNGIPNTIINPKCSLVQKGRYIGVKQALDAGCTHVMLIDSDMTMPPDAVLRLLSQPQSSSIVGCYYPKRQEGDMVVGTPRDGFGSFVPGDIGVIAAKTLGTGMMLINVNVFEHLPEPWFEVGFKDGYFISEDEHFCASAIAEGYSVWCDCDLSKEIGHIGSKEFKL